MNPDHALLHTTTSLLRASGKLLPFHLLLAALGGWRVQDMMSATAWTLCAPRPCAGACPRLAALAHRL